MTIPGKTPTTFEVLQFHIHIGSDHALGGDYFGAEYHIVHMNVIDSTKFAVLGFFLEPTNNQDANNFGDYLPGWKAVQAETLGKCGGNITKKSTASTRERRRSGRKLGAAIFDPYKLVPKNATFYYYSGSLTNPPCSEVVTWNVVDTPVSLSPREYVTITDLILDYVDPTSCAYASIAAPSGYTARPVQSINGRTITRKCPKGAGPPPPLPPPKCGFFRNLLRLCDA